MLLFDLELGDVKIKVLCWTSMQKMMVLLLVQGDWCHLDDTLVFIVLEALTSVNCPTGRPSWSPGMFGWDGSHMCDVWDDVEGDSHHLGDG